MTKRGDLTAALRQVTGEQEASSILLPAQPPAAQDAVAAVPPQLSRLGKHQISGYFNPDARQQFKQLVLDRRSNNQELLREALNDLFVKYRLPPIA